MLKKIGLILGLVLFLVILLMPTPAGLNIIAQKVLAVSLLMVTWWATDAIPMGITSLLPIALYPLLGITGVKGENGIKLLPYYSHYIIFMVMCIFIISAAIVKWNLHKRIALNIVKLTGTKPANVVLGFMLGTAIVSMFMSNTTATAMMIPIAASILLQLGASKEDDYGKCLMIGIPFAATIGGMGTIIGTSTNLTGVAFITENLGYEITFLDWMKIGVPFVIIIIPFVWLFLTHFYKVNKFKRVDVKTINHELSLLGKMKKGEIVTLTVLAVCMLLWITRVLWKKHFPFINDGTIAVIGATILFVFPLDWKTDERVIDVKSAFDGINWDSILMVGGALTMGSAFGASGCAKWLSQGIDVLATIPVVLMIISLSVLIAFITEVGTNVVIASAFLPVILGIAIEANIEPLPLLIAAILSSSFAFMLPAATPPNAVICGSGYVDVKDIAKSGLFVKFICIATFPLVWFVVTQNII